MAARDQVRCPQCGVPNDPGALFCARCGASQNRPGYSGSRRRRVSLAGGTMALACLIALGILVFVLYTIITHVLSPGADADTTTSIYSGSQGTAATLVTPTTTPANTSTTGGQTGKGSIVVRPSIATSSSSLEPTNLTDYRATNLLDGESFTAWVEGGKGTGAGEWVNFEFQEPIVLARIEIANGYQKDEAFFADYVRVKGLQVDYSDGTRQVVQLQDEQGLQMIEPAQSMGEIRWIKFTVVSVYPAYKLPQAALSDIKVYEVLQ